MNNSKYLVGTILFLAGLLYVFSVTWAGIASLIGKAADFQPLFTQAIVIIGAVLSTNLGAVLGVTFTPPGAGAKGAVPSPQYLKLKSTFRASKAATIANHVDGTQKLQIIACWVYIVSLVVALGCVISISFTKGIPVPILEDLSKTLVGVMCGVGAVKLGS